MEDTTRLAELLSTTAPAPEPTLIKMCKCGRGPWRKGQRNCLVCNREANTRYRESLKRPFGEKPLPRWPGAPR